MNTRFPIRVTLKANRVFIRPLSIFGETHAMTVLPVKAKYGLKNGYYVVSKSGYFLFEIVSSNVTKSSGQELKFDWLRKKTLIIDPKNVIKLNCYDYNNIEKLNLDMIGKFVNKGTGPNLIYKFNFKYCKAKDSVECKVEVNDLDELPLENILINIELSDFLMLQKLIDYSVPALMGWQFLHKGILEESEMRLENDQVVNEY